MKMTVLAAIGALIALTGCPSKPNVRQPDLRPLPEPRAVLGMLEKESASRKNLRATGRLTYFGDEGRIKVDVLEVIERPGSFRVELSSKLGAPETMTSNGERLWLLSKGKLYEGPATPENIARLLTVPLRPDELASIMLGGAPVTSRFTPKSVVWNEDEDDQWVLTLEDGSGERAVLIVDAKELRVVKATIGSEETPRLVLVFDDFEALPSGGAFPRSIEVEVPARKLEVDLKLEEVEVNVEISPTLFRIEAPPGVIPEPLPSPPVVLPVE